jgi:hypothetical protein
MISLQAQCDCLPSTGPSIQPFPSVDLCDGDTATLTVEIQPGSFSSFPDAFFVTRDMNRIAQEWIRYNTDTGFISFDDISAYDAVVGGASFNGDSVYLLIRPNQLVRTVPDILPLSFDTLSNPETRQGQFWVGLTYDEATNSFYALSNRNNQNTSLLYELDVNDGDTTLIDSLPAGARWLTSDGNGTLYVGFSTSDDLYAVDALTGEETLVGQFGFNARPCQGADFDQSTGLLYGLFLDGNDDSVLGIIDTATGAFCSYDTIGQEMNCPMVVRNTTISPSDYMYSWTPTDSMIGTQSATPQVFPSDTTTYTVTVTDACGNSSAASVIVNVIGAPDPLGPQSCLSDVNITLGQDCTAEVRPDALLTQDYECPNQFYEVSIDGRPEPILTNADLGQEIEAMVTPVGGGNSCWSTITVNDDTEPAMISCEDVTLSLGDPIPPIMAEDNCDPNPTVDILLTQYTDTVACSTPFLFAAVQTAVAEDASGNRSDVCMRTIFYRTPESTDFEFPDSLSEDTGNFISCAQDFPTEPNGLFPTPAFAGSPSYTGPVDLDDPNVPIDISYFDMPIVRNPSCKVSFMRNWFVVAWDCSQPDTIATHRQLIQILDKQGPTYTLPDIDTLSTNSSGTCEVSVNLPYPSNLQDSCSDIMQVDVTYGMFNSIPDLQPGGAVVNLPRGTTEVVYQVSDICRNSTYDTLMITVVDENIPTPVCRSANVGLNNVGPTRVYAQSFDDGSFDDCGDVELLVARMNPACGYGTDFGPFVEVTCCDVEEEVMIILQATDEAGNVNTCMTSLDVQDKSMADIVAPDDVTVSCEFPVTPNDLSIFGSVVITDNVNAINNRALEPSVEEIVLTDPGEDPVGPSVYGLDGVVFDNCDVTVSESSEIEDLGCNAYMIERVFSAVSNGTVEARDTQLIYVQNISEFSEANITWPKDTMLINACSGVETHPDSLDTPHAYPRINAEACSDVVISEPEDTRFFTLDPNDPTCYKIMRKWQVMDWCSPKPNGDPMVFEHFQLIKVVNNEGPEFTLACDDQSICTTDGDCAGGFVTLTQEATDDCTPESDLQWTYRIDLHSDGSTDEIGQSPDASGDYPLGTHSITWTVEDGCNNETSCIQNFEVVSCKLPTPICNPDIEVELTPMTMGQDTFGMSTIHADLIGGQSFHACGYDVTVSFSPDPSEQTLDLLCDDFPRRDVTIYVTDEKGRQDFCTTSVGVQDNRNVCDIDPDGLVPVTGSITNSETAQGLSETEIYISGDANFMTVTDENGYFEFPSLEQGNSFTIQPARDGDDLNGVNTFDILLLQRYILGLIDFDSPYKHIAADVDNNQRITGSDIVHLRRLILGVDPSLTQNSSWRFTDADYNFGGSDPLSQNFPERYDIQELINEMHIGFEPIKIGDIDMSANFNGKEAQTRFNSYITLKSEQSTYEAGEIASIPVYIEDVERLDGFQIQWDYNPNIGSIEGVHSDQLDLSSGNWVVGTDHLRISWSKASGHRIDEEQPLFYLDILPERRITLAQILSLASGRKFSSEIYTSSGMHGLKYRLEGRSTARPTFELKQNRPNPAEEFTIIDVQVPVTMPTTLVITNGNGQEVYRERTVFARGWNQFEIQTSNFGPSGVYFYSVSAGPFSDSKKMILVD